MMAAGSTDRSAGRPTLPILMLLPRPWTRLSSFTLAGQVVIGQPAVRGSVTRKHGTQESDALDGIASLDIHRCGFVYRPKKTFWKTSGRESVHQYASRFIVGQLLQSLGDFSRSLLARDLWNRYDLHNAKHEK